MRVTRKRLGALVVGAALVALVASACGGSSTGGGGGSSPSAGTKVAGGTATYAFDAGTGANYIFPVVAPAYFSTSNSNDFQFLLYRPLYWFGKSGTPNIDDSLSLANEPTYSADGKTVTITLKPYKWSDGTSVTARDVEFFNNLVKYNPDDYGGTVPGAYPSNILSTKIVNDTTIQFTMDKAYNHQWLLYNEFSNITPIPQHAWDKESATGAVGNDDETKAGAAAVYKYLDSQSKKTSTYASNPLWAIVDGPWKLTAFDSSGNLTMVPNPGYSGPTKPTLAQFKEVSYTDTAAEVNALSGNEGPDVGYISNVNLSQQPRLDRLGYAQERAYAFQISYAVLNFNNPKLGPLFKQTYIRQVLQELVDQQGLDKNYFSGIGYEGCGPVPLEPGNSFVSTYAKSCPFAYSPAKAKATLAAHGWTVTPGGVSTCASPGTGAAQCGSGIAAGAKLEFPYIYDTGGTSFPKSINQQKTDAEQAGVKFDLDPLPFNTAYSTATQCAPSSKACSWGIYNTAWVYEPDFYPSGEDLFQTGAGSNSGSYTDPTADKLIEATVLKTSQSPQDALDAYQDYLTKQLPVIWQGSDPTLNEVKKNLHGVTPFNVFTSLNPEEWYFTN